MAKKITKKKHCLSPCEILKQQLLKFVSESENQFELPDDIPSKWEKHGDLILLPANSFRSKLWSYYGDKLWDVVADSLKCSRLARKYSVHNNNYRSPTIELLRGSTAWVVHIDNKIKYSFDVTQCMFSAGNISEKLRIAKLLCEGETVVDLYAGIGYFTLPFLIHAKASKVHACEWNPYAVEALARNAAINGVKEKCIIHFGDNREVCPEKIADRVNLGLIPSSEKGWETACKALKPSGGILHIHGNVTSNLQTLQTEQCSPFLSAKTEWVIWSHDVCERISSILYQLFKSNWCVTVENIIRVKSYAPHIDHLVVDLLCKFNKDSIKN